MVFTRKRKILATPTEHSYSVGRVPSHHAAPSGGQATPLDVVDFQECEAESLKKPNPWDPNLDTSSYLEETLLPIKEKEKLMAHDESHLLCEAMKYFQSEREGGTREHTSSRVLQVAQRGRKATKGATTLQDFATRNEATLSCHDEDSCGRERDVLG